MSAHPEISEAEERYWAEVERQREADASISPLAAGILAGVVLGVAHDSRSFARLLGIEHALVLREVEWLFDAERLICIGRDERTSRTAYALFPEAPVAANDHV